MPTSDPTTISILSLVVAGVAVFVGPLVTWAIAKQQMAITKGQIDTAQRIADKQVIAPMRQAWINDLRKLLGEVLSASLHYYVAGYENRSDADYRRMTDVQQQMELMLNPTEDLHRGLVKAVGVLVAAIEDEAKFHEFPDLHKRANDLGHLVLKAEWERLKRGEPISSGVDRTA
jgi:hypothetical protein